jgi:hypothetical protein
MGNFTTLFKKNLIKEQLEGLDEDFSTLISEIKCIALPGKLRRTIVAITN